MGTIAWSELGLDGPADLVAPAVLVRTDGGEWTEATLATAPGDEVHDVVATSTGFLALVRGVDGDGLPRGDVWASLDGTSWARRSSGPAGAFLAAADGDRLLGAPADAWPSQVVVGADHVAVTYTPAQEPASEPQGTVALLATPRR